MGWMSYDIWGSPKAECDRILNQKSENYESKVLKSYMKGNVYYAAVSLKTPEEECVYAAVFLTNYSPRATKEYNFSVKEMDETVGPCYYDFPEKYLKLLTPTNSKYALEWREEVKKVIEHKKKLSKIKVGEKIRFKATCDMASGIKIGDDVILIKEKKYFLYKNYWRWSKNLIPNNFEIIKEDK